MDMGTESKATPVKISFGVRKKEDTLVKKQDDVVLDVPEDSEEERETEEEQRAAKKRKLTYFEDGFMPEDEEDSRKKAKIVIPMLVETDWRVKMLKEEELAGTISDSDRARLALLTVSQPFAVKQEASIVVDEKSKKEAEDADYSQIAVESFGLAYLRGCEWKEGEGIGKNPQVVPLRLPERRPNGLGLGAVPKTEKKGGRKEGDNKEELQEIKQGSCVKITQGRNKGAYAKVEARDDNNSSLFVRLALGGQSVRVSLFSVYTVTQKEYERDGKCINKDDYDKEKSRLEKEKMKQQERKKERRREEDESVSSRERGRENDAHSDRSRTEEMWVRVDLTVRVVTEDYKRGKYLDEKMRVIDAPEKNNITLLDQRGDMHYHMRQSWLETVIPRENGQTVMIVRGKRRGEKAVMREKDKKRCILYALLIHNQELVKVDFDDVCSWQPRVIEEDDL